VAAVWISDVWISERRIALSRRRAFGGSLVAALDEANKGAGRVLRKSVGGKKKRKKGKKRIRQIEKQLSALTSAVEEMAAGARRDRSA
jgi:hypothetical protein